MLLLRNQPAAFADRLMLINCVTRRWKGEPRIDKDALIDEFGDYRFNFH